VCDDLHSLLAAIGRHNPDVVLTDIRMPPTHTDEGIRAATHLFRTDPQAGTGVTSAMAQRLRAFVTDRLLSSRDVFTARTPVKQNEGIGRPLVSKLTMGMLSPPLDRPTRRPRSSISLELSPELRAGRT
jgi:hypothetical protein